MIAAGDLELRDPIPGESLDGYIAAIVGDNDLGKVRSITAAGGIAHGHRPQLTTMGWNGLPALAEILEVDVEELRFRSYPFVGEEGSRRAFFGTTIQRADLRTRERFFSPSALIESEHHRAMWQLKLPFDVENGELLVSTCPRPTCRKVQRWRQSAGVAYCDTCVEELGKHDVPRLGEDLLPEYRLATGLTHTDRARRGKSLALLPAEIQAIGADMAYELLLRLVPVMHGPCSWRTGSRIWNNQPQDIAQGLVEAWRALLGWPNVLLDKMRCDVAVATRRFNDGNGGRTLDFLRLRSSAFIAAPVARTIRSVHASIDEDGPDGDEVRHRTIGCKEASKLTGIHTSLIADMRRKGVLMTHVVARGPVIFPLYDRAEIEQLDRDIRRRWDLNQGSLPLGLPYYALEQLCALGHLPRLTHPYFTARYPEPQITGNAVVDLACKVAAAASTCLGDTVPILEAIRMIGGRLKPWDAVIEAMLSRTLPFEFREGDDALFARIRVRRDDLRGPASLPITRPGTNTALTIIMQPGFPFVPNLTKRDAGEILNLRTVQYTRHLKSYRTTSERIVPIDEILDMSAAHMTNSEIAEHLGIAPQTVRWMAQRMGIPRISETGYDRALAERDLVPALAPKQGGR